MTEDELQRQVLATADQLGYEYVHFRPALTAKGWRTPVQGSAGKGFPDLVMWHPQHHVPPFFVELKSLTGRLSDDQLRVLETLRAAHATVHIWTPRDWNDQSISRILIGQLRTPRVR